MGVRTTIGDRDYEITQYSVSEDSTPTAVTDSTGSVGAVTFTIKRPDENVERGFTPDAFTNPGWGQTEGFQVVSSNLAENPNFNNPLLVPPGASRSSDWSVSGGFSLFVPDEAPGGNFPSLITFPATNNYPTEV